jgi:hypothetical protein
MHKEGRLLGGNCVCVIRASLLGVEGWAERARRRIFVIVIFVGPKIDQNQKFETITPC